MSDVLNMEIIEETKNGDLNQLASNIIQSPQQYLILSKTKITTSGSVQMKSEPSESDSENEIDSQLSSSVQKKNTKMEIEERADASIQCLQCQRIFKDIDGLTSHTILIHGIPTKPFQCAQCSAKFIKAEHLSLREFSHHGAWLCNQCPKSFALSEGLRDHIESFHSKSETKKKLKEQIHFMKEKFVEKRQRVKERKKNAMESAPKSKKVKKIKQMTLTNIEEEISSADHESNEATTSNSAENFASTSTNMRELNLVCFYCPRRFESEPALNSHLTLYHRVERTEID